MEKILGKLGLFLLLALSSCGRGSYFRLNNSSADVLRHRVRYSGETIGSISLWYTGTSENWRAIRSVNPSLNPKKLKIGDTVGVPRHLLVRSQPMPESFIGKSATDTHAVQPHVRDRVRREPATAEAEAPASDETAQAPVAEPEASAVVPAAAPSAAPAESSGASSVSEQEDRLIRALVGEK